ncbi:unnamed protein product [Fasciola hepatica]|uniref:Uncharacterized protein n=1 Tax=Fasciola hepatica TaxID=6192 RepID=A0ABC9HI92_FASHE
MSNWFAKSVTQLNAAAENDIKTPTSPGVVRNLKEHPKSCVELEHLVRRIQRVKYSGQAVSINILVRGLCTWH